jgi:hypothetical protein
VIGVVRPCGSGLVACMYEKIDCADVKVWPAELYLEYAIAILESKQLRRINRYLRLLKHQSRSSQNRRPPVSVPSVPAPWTGGDHLTQAHLCSFVMKGQSNTSGARIDSLVSRTNLSRLDRPRLEKVKCLGLVESCRLFTTLPC